MQKLTGEQQLLRKYNVPGPRYTSYPTVPFWQDSPTPQQWIEHIAGQLKPNQGAAIYVHLPFCESLCTYCGCNTRITRNHGVEDPYIDTVLEEWSLYAKALGLSQQNPLALTELHLGGGTPTFMAPANLARLIDGLLKFCRLTDDAEFSVEVDPRVTKKEHLEALRERGFRRISLGVQDFDPKVQDIVHRTQSEEQVATVTNIARELGYQSVNYDLIYGLPLQTEDSIRQTIEAVKRLRPDRIAFYAYAHVPWIKPSQRRFTEADLPAGEIKRRLYEVGRELLESAGYIEIGMDHFALPSDSLWKAVEEQKLHRNFMGYTSRLVAPQFGLGVSAIGDAWTCFAQNEKVVEKYQERVKKGEIPIFRGHILNEEDLLLRPHILNMMTRGETQWKLSEMDELGRSFFESLPHKLDEFVKDGILTIEPESVDSVEKVQTVRVGRGHRAFLRNVCMAFDARLQRQQNQPLQLFSKTI